MPARWLNRERAIIVMLRRKRVEDLPPPDDLNEIDQVNDELGELEVYEPGALVGAAPAEVESLGGADADDNDRSEPAPLN